MGGNGTGAGSLVRDGPFAEGWNVVYDGAVREQGLSRAWGTPLGAMGHAMAGRPADPLPTDDDFIANLAVAGDPVLPDQEELFAALMLDVYDTPPYTDASHEPPSFRNTFEGWEKVGCHLHNSVHLWMGGEMRLVAISPNDPIFWLHHAFVDKVMFQ
jgi:hypothetical protein